MSGLPVEKTLWERAEQALENGDFAVAIACYEELCKVQANYPEAVYFLGLACLLYDGPEIGPDAAQEIWMGYIDPLNFECFEEQLTSLAQILLAEGTRQLKQRRFGSAQRLFQQVMDIDDASVVAMHGLGVSLVQQGQFDAAIEMWQRAIALDPTHGASYHFWAKACEDIRDWDSAATAYRLVITHCPPNADAYAGLGRCLLHQGAIADAQTVLQMADELDSEQGDISGNLGWAYFVAGNVRQAIATWRRTLALQPSYWQDLAQWQMAKSLTEPGLALNGVLIQALQQPEDGQCVKALGDRFQSLGWQEGAQRCFDLLAEVSADQDQLSDQPSSSIPQSAAAPSAPPKLSTAKANTVDTLVRTKTFLRPCDAGAQKPPNQCDHSVNAIEPERDLTSSRPLRPTQVCYRTEDWIAQQSEHGHYRSGFPPSMLPLVPPRSLNETLHPSFRYDSPVSLPGSFVVELVRGRYYTDGVKCAAAIAPDQTLLGDLSPFSPLLSPGHPAAHPTNHPLLKTTDLPPLQTVEGTVAIISGLSDNVYFHWMLDLLPRLELLRIQGWTPDTVDTYLVEANTAFQQETLTRLGIPLEKTRSPQHYPHIEAEQLVIPSFPAAAAWMPQWACQFLRQTFLADEPPSIPTPRRLFISRATANTRRLINETAVVQALSPLGFEVIELDGLSVQAQAVLFAQAEVVVGIHGSGLTNLVFASPKTIMVELFSPFFVYPCYWLLANWQELTYFYVLGQAPEGPFFHRVFYPDTRCEDIWVDPQHILNTLKQAGLATR